MVKRLLNYKSKTIFSAAFIMAVMALLSRILGLVRDRLLAGKFGAGNELDIYFTAFRLPDLIYGILIMGAISSAFIPIFAQYWQKDKKEAWQLVSGVLNLFFLILIFSSAVIIFFAPLLIHIIAPGFSGEKREMTVLLTRIMFLSPLLLGISSIFSGVLQYFRRFFIYSLAPIMYNLGIIIGILFFVPRWGLIGLAWGVVLGAFLHLLIQLPSTIYSGFRWQTILTFCHQGIKKIFRLMIPRTIGLAGSQINFLVINALASSLAIGSIAIFNLANNLQYVPIGIIGISFAMAAFPSMAKSFAEENREKFSKNFSATFSQILYLVMPLTVIFFLLRAQIIRLILGTGQFGWADTRLTAAALGIFSLGIFAQSLIPLISRAFYSFHNTKTPVSISLLSIGLNIGASFIFVWLLNNDNWFANSFSHYLKLSGIKSVAVLGLPLAFVLSSIFNFFVLIKIFSKKIKHWGSGFVLSSFFKILISCLFMGLAIYLLLQLMNLFVNNKTFIGLLIQTSVAGIGGGIVYFLISLFFKSPEPSILINKFKSRNNQPIIQADGTEQYP